jgi:hypothetical protein
MIKCRRCGRTLSWPILWYRFTLCLQNHVMIADLKAKIWTQDHQIRSAVYKHYTFYGNRRSIWYTRSYLTCLKCTSILPAYLHLVPRSCLFIFGLPTKHFIHFSSSFLTFPTHLILLDLINRIVFCEWYRSWHPLTICLQLIHPNPKYRLQKQQRN